MADDDAEVQRPSLEPPKLFRRRPRKPRGGAETTGTPTGTPMPQDEPVEPVAASPEVADETEVVDPGGVEEPVEDPADDLPETDPTQRDSTEPDPIPVAAAEPSAPEPATEPEAEEPGRPEPQPMHPDGEADGDEVVVVPAPAASEEKRPGFTDAASVPAPEGGDPDKRSPEASTTAAASAAPGSRTESESGARAPREPRGPLLVGRNAALATGLVVGILILLLGAGGSATCEAVRGTSACGAALGIPILVVVVAVATAVGAILLRLFHLPDPAATSFMAVALVAVVTGLFLTDALEQWPARLVYPVGVALAFLASWWLAVSFDDPDVVRRAREYRERQQV